MSCKVCHGERTRQSGKVLDGHRETKPNEPHIRQDRQRAAKHCCVEDGDGGAKLHLVYDREGHVEERLLFLAKVDFPTSP